MKTGIHPAYAETNVVCGCGNTFTTRSTKDGGHITVEVCSQCHPFYTGKQKLLDTTGNVDRFKKRVANAIVTKSVVKVKKERKPRAKK